MGQDGGMNVDDFADEQLIQMARASLDGLFGEKGEPFHTQLDRWTRAMPQYDLGHCERMDQVEQALSGKSIYLAGGSFRGTGIPDCIRQGREAAKAIQI
jgi:oxygen-dependent protoporphyrinogen oxidase